MIKEEEKKEPQKSFNEDKEAEQEYSKHWIKFLRFKENRDQPIHFFNKNGVDRTLIDYVKDSVDRMNEFHESPAWKEDWQNNAFDPITRNKLIAILSRIASSRMKPELIVSARSIFSNRSVLEKKQVFSDLLENANRHNKDDVQEIWEMYTAMSEGTVIGYESWKKDARKVEYVKEIDPDTGECKTETISVNSWDDVFGEIVPIEEFYPENIWVHDISQIKRVFRKQVLKYDTFMDQYGGFSNSSKVMSAGYYRDGDTFEWGITEDVNDDEVLVLQYYDEVEDKLKIWGNGTELYNGPMPWNHKKLPFWMAIFEPIHHQFLYGKSLPDKLMGMQDIDNALFNAMLDQILIGLNSPIFISGDTDDIDNGYLEPGKIYHGESDAKMSRVNLGTVDATTYNMLSLIKQGMEETSISAQATGVATGGRKTKYEVQTLQEGALSLASLFLQMAESSYSQKYWLRMYNIIQYYSMPSNVGSGKLKFKFITLDNRKLTNGKIGRKMIQISDQIPENAKSKLADIATQESGQEFNPLTSTVEPIIITRDWLMDNDFDLEIHIVPNSSIKESDADRKNKAIAYYQMTANNPLYDQEVLARSLTEAFDQPEDSVKKQTQTQGGNDIMSGLPNLGQPQSQGGQDMNIPDVSMV